MIPSEVHAWLDENGYGAVITRRPMGGGCINSGAILESESGKSFFLKTNANNPADMFEREAEGLAALAATKGPRTPRSYLYGRDFLLLEDLKPAARRSDYWQVFGRQMAALHKQNSPDFGFGHNNYIGSTPQPNPWTVDGYTFFSEHRLLLQAQMARRRGLLGQKEESQEVQEAQVVMINGQKFAVVMFNGVPTLMPVIEFG